MTSTTGNNPTRRSDPRAAFTLVELLIVMSMLTIVIAVAAPSLANFFRGRTLDSEARRFLSLTRYGQSRAVAEGVPVMLWVDVEKGTYGLTRETSYSETDEKAVDVTVEENVQLEVQDGVRFVRNGRSLTAIHFMPDGGVGNASFTGLSMDDGEGEPISIVQSANELNYEIQDRTTKKPR